MSNGVKSASRSLREARLAQAQQIQAFTQPSTAMTPAPKPADSSTQVKKSSWVKALTSMV